MAHSSLPHENSRPLQRASGLLLVADTPKGRGVFASESIPQGTVIDVSPVLIFSPEEVNNHTSQTCLQHYTYYWPTPNSKSRTEAVALGLGSLFNHSNKHQNVTWTRDIEAHCIVYTAYRDIEIGEELCISYGNGRLWFVDADQPNEEDERLDGQGDMSACLPTEIEQSGLARIDL